MSIHIANLYGYVTDRRLGPATPEQVAASNATVEGTILVNADGDVVEPGTWGAEQPGVRVCFTRTQVLPDDTVGQFYKGDIAVTGDTDWHLDLGYIDDEGILRVEFTTKIPAGLTADEIRARYHLPDDVELTEISI